MSSVTNKSVEDFKKVVVEETKRLTDLCCSWRVLLHDKSTKDKRITEEIIGDIHVAVGQADLLMKQRFNQFNGLISNCEFNTGEQKTTIEDLQGFWDIIYFQIEDIIKKFQNLEDLKSNDWKPKTVIKIVKRVKVPLKVPGPSKARPAQSSALRAHILAARNKMNTMTLKSQSPLKEKGVNSEVKKSEDKENVSKDTKQNETYVLKSSKENILGSNIQENSKDNKNKVKTPPCTPSKNPKLSVDMNTFDAGFFKVQTPSKKAKAPHKTPAKQTILAPSDKEEGKVLSSSVLKERVKKAPPQHKDYTPCMRITRSMKKL